MTSKPLRVDPEFERWLSNIRKDISKIIDKEITMADTQRIIASTRIKPIIIVPQKRRKRIRFDDLL